MQVGKPWPLAPNAWTPTPNSTEVGAATRIEIAFATPVISPTLVSALTVQDGASQPVNGTLELIADLEGGKVIGLSFMPTDGLPGQVFGDDQRRHCGRHG